MACKVIKFPTLCLRTLKSVKIWNLGEKSACIKVIMELDAIQFVCWAYYVLRCTYIPLASMLVVLRKLWAFGGLRTFQT